MRRWLLGIAVSCVFSGGCALLPAAQEEARATRYKTPSELYDKALGYYQSGKYVPARDLFHEYIGQYPESRIFRIALYYLGHCYQMLGEDKEALALYDRVVTTWGDEDFWGQQALARIKQIKGQE
jgi:TolA-binding protein